LLVCGRGLMYVVVVEHATRFTPSKCIYICIYGVYDKYVLRVTLIFTHFTEQQKKV